MTRRSSFLFSVLCLLAVAPSGASRAWASGGVLVMNSGAASLSVIDMSSRTEVRRIPALREPHHVVLTPDGRDLLVGDTVGNELIDLDPATFEVRRRLTVSDPYQLGFSPDAKYLVVAGLARAQVDVYEAGTYKLVKRFALASMPSHIAFAPDSAVAYVSLQGTGKLAAIDLRHMALRWKADVGPAPAGVLWNDGRVLVAIMGSDYVAVVDPVTGHVERRIKTGKGAHQLFLSPDGKLIYVNNRIAGTVMALDATSLEAVRTYKMPGGPDDIAFAPDGHLWITLRFALKVAVLDPVTGDYSTIDVGRSPHGIFINAQATVH
jgi:DNA-binding beta-propeller fold protein YncE